MKPFEQFTMFDKSESVASDKTDLFTLNKVGEMLKVPNIMVTVDPRKENSRAARLKKLPSMSSDKGRILRCLMNYGGDMHARHMEQHCNLEYHQIQRRLKEMVNDGLIEITGKRDGMTTYKKK